MGDIAPLFARVGPGFFQQAFVVEDLGTAQQAMTAGLVTTPFVTLPPAMLGYRLRGREVECSLALGFARSGNVQIELLQPVAGEGIHAEFLAEHGPGAHHLGFMVDRLDDEVSRANGWGFPEVMAGAFGNLRFAYLDTFAAFGLYVELVEDPDGMMNELMAWRDPE